MKAEITVKKEVDLKTIHVCAKVRYWEDSEVNGVSDTESGDNIPFHEGDSWKPIVDIDSGQIMGWPKGTTASIHYKVCDCFAYKILDENGQVVLEGDDYVPGCFAPKESGYGDYIIMDIDENGIIQDWEFEPDNFINED